MEEEKKEKEFFTLLSDTTFKKCLKMKIVDSFLKK